MRTFDDFFVEIIDLSPTNWSKSAKSKCVWQSKLWSRMYFFFIHLLSYDDIKSLSYSFLFRVIWHDISKKIRFLYYIRLYVYNCRIKIHVIYIHYDDVTMSGVAFQITSLTMVYSTFHPGADRRKHQSPASLAFVRGIHRGPVNSPHKWPVTRKLFPFDDVIMMWYRIYIYNTISYQPQAGLFLFKVVDIFHKLYAEKSKKNWKIMQRYRPFLRKINC